MIWIILDHFRADRAPVEQQRLPRPKGKGKDGGQYTTSACPALPVPHESGGVECNSPSDGLCWTFAQWGKCWAKGCTLQHLSAKQLMVAIEQGIETELVSTAAEPLAKGGDRTKSQKDRVDKHERKGKIDMATLPVAVRRRLCRPRWCKEYLLGCCERSSRSLPHHSESVVAEIKEKEAVYKGVAGTRVVTRAGTRAKRNTTAASATATAATAPSANSCLPFDEDAGGRWARGRARNRVSRDTGPKISGPHYFMPDFGVPDRDGEADIATTICPVAIEVVPAMCAAMTDDGDVERETKAVRFDLPDDHEEKPTWRGCRSSAPCVVPGPAYSSRCIAARISARQTAIDLANVVDNFECNANRQWKTDAGALFDDRRVPILWITTETGLIYDYFSACRTDHDDYRLDVNYKRMRDVTELHPDANCRDPKYEHHWLYLELITVVDHALKKPVFRYKPLKKPYKQILDLGDAVPTSHGYNRRINMRREFEPALCAVLATGCDAQLQAGAVPGTGCVDDFSPRAVPGTGCAHNWIGDETPVEDSMAEIGGCADVSIRWTFPKRVTQKKRRIKRGTKLHSVQSTSKAATTEKVDCMSDHTLYGNNTISPSTTRETELPVGLKVLDDRASINSFPSPS